MKSFFTVAILVALTAAFSGSVVEGKDYITFNKAGLKVPAAKNVTLSMDCVIAVSETVGERFPVLVFPNSWGMPQIEYIEKIHQLAKKGYIACEYETRGWWFSGGLIDTAGLLDREDTTSVIKFIQAKSNDWQVNTTNFGFLGISYGAGMSLMAAGQNPTIVKTAVAMSGWGKLNEGFYYHGTPGQASMHHLLEDAAKYGHPDASLEHFYNWAIKHENMSVVWDFMHSRSPELLFLDTYKKYNTPIFLSDNQDDNFFFPQAKAEFYNNLPGPKFQLINQGGHAVPEVVGLLGGKNYIWEKVEMWVDYWLKGIQNGIMAESALQMQDSNTLWGTDYKQLSSWGDKTMETKRWYMDSPDFLAPFAKFDTTAPKVKKLFGHDIPNNGDLKWDENHTLGLGWKLEPLREVAGIDPSLLLLSYNKKYDLLFKSEPFEKTTVVCGTPNVTLSLTVPSNRKWQVYGVVYEISEMDIPPINLTKIDHKLKGMTPNIDLPLGHILGDFQVTYWGNYNTPNETSITIADEDITPGKTNATETVKIRNLNARTICHTFPANSSFAMGFALHFDQFASSPEAKEGLELVMNYGEDSYVDMPYLN